MPHLPDKPPLPFLDYCKRLQLGRGIDAQLRAEIKNCIEAVESNREEKRKIAALLYGIVGCDGLSKDRFFRQWQASRQFAREQVRQKNSVSNLFKKRSEEAHAYSKRGLTEAQNAIIFGFICFRGFARVSAPQWRPLLPIIAKLISPSDDDDPERVLNVIRQRIRRFRRKYGETGARSLAQNYLDGVYVRLFS